MSGMLIKEEIKHRLNNKILDWQENPNKRIFFTVSKGDIFEVTKFLFKELGLRFSTASGMDSPAGFEIIYHFSDDKTGYIYSARIIIEDKKRPEVESITPIFNGAEWIEREMWELLGINFKGHPNLTKLLLADDWPQGKYPLRKEK